MKYLPIDEMWNELTPEQWNELKPWEILACDLLYRFRDWERFITDKGFEDRRKVNAALAAIDPELLQLVNTAFEQLAEITKHKNSPENLEFKTWVVANKHIIGLP